MDFTHVFWDWNGTLLNDISACVASMNQLLTKRGMAVIDEKYYKSVFGFPVKEYYKILGFDLSQDSFEMLSNEFIAEYTTRSQSSSLQQHAFEILNFFEEKKIEQVVISAMEKEMLLRQIESQGIKKYFTEIIGLSDIYANSKLHLAEKYVSEKKLNPLKILFIGDTLHDAEVANNLGCNLLLVSNGHHSKERLTRQNHSVISSLEEYFTLSN